MNLFWDASRAGEALQALAAVGGITIPAPPEGAVQDPRRLGEWLQAAGLSLGVEVDGEVIYYGQMAHSLASWAPALLRRPNGDLLALADGESVILPDGSRRKVGAPAILAVMGSEVEAPLLKETDDLLDAAEVRGGRRQRTRQALLKRRLTYRPVGHVWSIRTDPGASFGRQLRKAGVWPRAAALSLAYGAQYSLWIACWWILGEGAMQGRLDSGLLAAWALLLLSIIPLRGVITWQQGHLAIMLGGILKERELCGALRMDPAKIRSEGAGQLLGRVIESEQLEALALSGGFLALMTVVELALSACVLAAAAGGIWHAGLLILWIGIGCGLAWRYYGRAKAWSEHRLWMTHDLVERMVGHRTRLTQEPVEHWHEAEDEALQHYEVLSQAMDRQTAMLKAILPRGWLVLGIAGLAPGFVSASASPAGLAAAIGGVLLAYNAFKRLSAGLWSLAGAAIAWQQVSPLFHAAADREKASVAALIDAGGSAEHESVIEAHDLTFRYGNRAEPILRRCNLTIAPGDRLLLEGPSGSGKSTLSGLLTGMLQPESGLLLVQGLDRHSLSAAAWRRRVAAAPQFHENHVMTSPFAHNVLLGRQGWITEEDYVEAEAICRELGLGPLLDRMPAGMLQMVGEGGWQLSHGERSRVFMALTLLSAISLFAQAAPTTSLSGTVADPSGSFVPNAALELTNTGTHWNRKGTTDSQGRFQFTLVPPGRYDLTVAASGFAGLRQQGFQLDADVPATLRLTVSVAASVTQVTIKEDAPMVDAQSGTVRQVVGEAYIQDLPLNGRNAAALVYMAPGTVLGKGTDTATYATTDDTLAVSANGTMGNQVAYKLDGASHQDNITNLNAAFPNPDALSQFTVETNNFDAKYGGSGGAVVNIVTRSGTNQIHGTAFEFLRNGDLNARNFFAPQQDAIKRNQFGGTVGGPIKKDKLFFFGSWQRTILHNTTFSNTAFVPTDAQRTGNFAGKAAIYDQTTGIAFPGNIIPASMISPIALAMMPHIPTSTDPTGKLLYAQPQFRDNQQFLGKFDYNAGSHQLSGSYFRIHFTDDGWDGGGTLLNYKIGQDQVTHSFKLGDTWTITPNLLNSLTFSGLVLNSTQTRTAPFSIFDFGNIKATKPEARFQETGITVTSYSGWGSGGTQPPGDWLRNNFEVSEILTYMHGAHSMHFGGTWVPWTRFDSATGYQEEPLFTFTGTATASKPSGGTGGSGLADLMIGRAATFTQTAGKAKFTRGRQISAFFQDQWRVTNRLTLNLGVRWDPFVPWTDPVAEQVGGYVPGAKSQRFPNAPTGMLFAGDPNFPEGGVYSNLANFAPRLGFAYTVNGGNHPTTIRGGWGLFYIQPFARLYNNFVQNAPFSPSAQLTGVALADPFGSAGVQNPFPPFAPVHPNAQSTFILPIAYQFFDPHWHIGHTRGYNFTIEHQFTRSLVARASYVGTQGRDLQAFQEVDPAIYSATASSSNINARRPLAPNYASMIQMTNDGYSNYNAFQFTVEHRLSHGLNFVANYTFSKGLDNESVEAQLTVTNPNPFVPNFNYGRSDLDTTHNFSFWTVYNLPKLSQANRFLRGAFGGWQTTGIWSWRSGLPVNATSGSDRSLSGVGQDRADLVGDPYLTSDRPRSQLLSAWFNAAAFTQATAGTFGNSPRNLLRAPGLFNLDWSLSKGFQIHEGVQFQVRGDFFNLLNNPHFNAPGSSVAGGSTFGKISSAADPRILQISMRLRF